MISKLEEEVECLKKAMNKMAEKEKTRTKVAPATKGTDGTGPQGSKKELETVPKPPSKAWQGPKPDWQTVGKGGKVVKVLETDTPKNIKKEVASDEAVARFISGQPPQTKRTKVYLCKGGPEMEIFPAKGSHVKAGNTTTVDPPSCNGGDGHTRATSVRRKSRRDYSNPQRKGTLLRGADGTRPLPGIREDIKNAEARLKRQIGRLPAPMHTTRKALNGQLEIIQSKLKHQGEIEKEAASKAMDVTEPEVPATGDCSGTQRTDV